ncbi:unnamed protein product [Cuscuta campestris]|uniref:Uncharacterized protein n=1 Tax=Cuscuta campestris TaxID=132261 RepID=A0A484M5I1_9ASTE|nr:unnamed protein product [Cuscuta campestris]
MKRKPSKQRNGVKTCAFLRVYLRQPNPPVQQLPRSQKISGRVQRSMCSAKGIPPLRRQEQRTRLKFWKFGVLILDEGLISSPINAASGSERTGEEDTRKAAAKKPEETEQRTQQSSSRPEFFFQRQFWVLPLNYDFLF